MPFPSTLSSFCSDEEITEVFADDKLFKFLFSVLETASSTPQSQQACDDCLAILDGVAHTARGRQVRESVILPCVDR